MQIVDISTLIMKFSVIIYGSWLDSVLEWTILTLTFHHSVSLGLLKNASASLLYLVGFYSRHLCQWSNFERLLYLSRSNVHIGPYEIYLHNRPNSSVHNFKNSLVLEKSLLAHPSLDVRLNRCDLSRISKYLHCRPMWHDVRSNGRRCSSLGFHAGLEKPWMETT